MPLDTQAPAALVTRFTEDGEVIEFRVPGKTARIRFLQLSKDPLHGHDHGRFIESDLAKAAAKQLAGLSPLGFIHVLDADALARVLGNEVPVDTCGVIVIHRGCLSLLLVERSQEILGRCRHPPSGGCDPECSPPKTCQRYHGHHRQCYTTSHHLSFSTNRFHRKIAILLRSQAHNITHRVLQGHGWTGPGGHVGWGLGHGGAGPGAGAIVAVLSSARQHHPRSPGHHPGKVIPVA